MTKPFHLISVALLGFAACTDTSGGSSDPSCADGGKCDGGDVPKTACDSVFQDMTGRPGAVKAGSLADPMAKAIFLQGTTCPTTFNDLMTKLRQTDADGCSDPNAGMEFRAVSERSQGRQTPETYRLVLSRSCGGRQPQEMLISLFGAPAQGGLPQDFETINFDRAANMFNYYAVEGGVWKYMGNSRDMILNGPGQGDVRRCANCHVGGGLVMKELVSPWIDWEGDIQTPGVDALATAHPELGSHSNGIELEQTVRAGNDTWSTKRVDILQNTPSVSAADMLKPLFCTSEFQLHTGAFGAGNTDNTPGGTELSAIPSDYLSDPLFSVQGVQIDSTDYHTQVAAVGQHITDSRTGGTELNGAGQPMLDTIVKFVFPTPGAIDQAYTDKLVANGVLDAKFVQDVRFVDFTRPVFSDDRCGLLQFAPTLDGTSRSIDKIRAGFIANLQAAQPAAGTPAAAFLASLMDANSNAAQQTKVQAFATACSARDKHAFLVDSMAIVSARRNTARSFPVLEFPETLPADNQQVDPASRLDPTTCNLSTQFVAP